MRILGPLDYGITEAADPIERYEILQKCHQEAVTKDYAISYLGIDTLRLEIPNGAEPLPLTEAVDFAGVTIIVENNQKDCFLYMMRSQMSKVQVCGPEIDKGVFDNGVFNDGSFLLVVEDEEPWCSREGYDSSVKRKDAMIIINGRASSSPVSSYSTPVSKPVAKYRPINNKKILIKNLNFERSRNSSFETYCISVVNQVNVELNNIRITTPENKEKYADKAIYLENCVDVWLNDISIYGTYSLPRRYGYGICLMNITNLRINRMYGRGNWGVFGTHCLNNVVLKDCDINRFDIHSYGKDVKAIGCKFTDLYNQFSSIFGTIEFYKCLFKNFRPVLIESSYNAYTPFNLIWRKCTFFLDEKHNFLVTLYGVPAEYNNRPELRRKSLPNIRVQNCKVILSDDVKTWHLVETGGVKYQDSFDGIQQITIKGLKVKDSDLVDFKLFSEEIETTNPVTVNVNGNKRIALRRIN